MTSIIQKNYNECYVCKSTVELEEHHCMGGTANRKLSEKYGLKVKLCSKHHNIFPWGVHRNKELAAKLHAVAQTAFEEKYGKEEWMKIFQKNYL